MLQPQNCPEFIYALENWSDQMDYEDYIDVEPELNSLIDRIDSVMKKNNLESSFNNIANVVFDHYCDASKGLQLTGSKFKGLKMVYDQAMLLAPDSRVVSMKRMIESSAEQAALKIIQVENMPEEERHATLYHIDNIRNQKSNNITKYLNKMIDDSGGSGSKLLAVTAFEESVQKLFNGVKLRKKAIPELAI
jgi:hypothetical protein